MQTVAVAIYHIPSSWCTVSQTAVCRADPQYWQHSWAYLTMQSSPFSWFWCKPCAPAFVYI